MRKKKKAQSKVVEEILSQLMVQAERLGTRENFSPNWFVEQKVLLLGNILSEFYAERSNLEYEINLTGTDKKDVLIKLEKLHSYIRKGEALRGKYIDKFDNMLDKDFKLTECAKKLRCLEKMDIKTVA